MPQEFAKRKSIEPYIKDEISYYSHQAEGIRRAATMTSFLLADEMGLGKSLQALTVFGIDLYLGRSQTMLIVCPTTLKVNWANEIEKFMGDVRYMILSQKSPAMREKELRKFDAAPSPKILVINYEQVKPHLDMLNEMEFDIALWDEAHMLKNPLAARTKASHKLIRTRTFLLTGSPVLNHVNDVWSLMHMIAPAAWGSYHGFLNTYAAYGGYQDKQIVGVKNPEELNNRINQVMIRRLKKDVLDLPEVQYIPRVVGLTPLQKKLYTEVINNLQLTTNDNGEPEDIENALTKFLRLKQICGTTATVLESKEDQSEKLSAAAWDAVNLINDGNRVVAFTQFREVQEAYANRLDGLLSKGKFAGKGVLAPVAPIFILNGDVPAEERQIVVDQWANSEVPGIIICMFQVAGVGLNMVAAQHGQFLDKLWNPPLNQQAVDRMHRIGASTTQQVQIFEYICKDTAEERVEEVLRIKRKVADSVIEVDDYMKKVIAQAMLEEQEDNE